MNSSIASYPARDAELALDGRPGDLIAERAPKHCPRLMTGNQERMSASPPEVVAYGDESFLEAVSGGYYVIAAALLHIDQRDHTRETMLGLRGARSTAKTHWTEMDAVERKGAAVAVAEIDGLHIVVTGTPVPPRKQERARARCLERLVPELHGFGVGSLVMESRGRALDQRDVRAVIGARLALPRGATFSSQHIRGRDEPLLWVADILAGAMRAGRHGDQSYQSILSTRVLDIDVVTGC